VILARNNFPSIVGEEREWYLLQKFNSVPHHLLDIQTTPPHGHPAHVSSLEQIWVVPIPGVGVTFTTVIDMMSNGSGFKLVNL
jgi:hypothetical protein